MKGVVQLPTHTASGEIHLSPHGVQVAQDDGFVIYPWHRINWVHIHTTTKKENS